jgi:putative Holliday junction resolvase
MKGCAERRRFELRSFSFPQAWYMALQHQGRIAGIDYGTVRIGIALADLEVGIASPYETYQRRNPELDARYFLELAASERLARFVVGLPVHAAGHESQKSLEARRYGAWLESVTQVPVEYFDERYTSVEAEQLLGQAELTKKRRKERLDKLAAQIMLTAYLESGARGQSTVEGLE